jgi:hypothetical protein
VKRVRITLALALAIGLAVVVVAVLSESPLTVIAKNDAAGMETSLGWTKITDTRICQEDETVPGGTIAIRFSLYALTGPPVEASVLYGDRTVALGERGSGWTGASVTVPIREVARSISPVTLCLAATTTAEPMQVLGTYTGRQTAAYEGPGEALGGRMKIVYLGRGHDSWLSLTPYVARHMGLGRAWSGTWVAVLVLALMLAGLGLISALVLREFDV